MKTSDVLCLGIVNMNILFRPVPLDMMQRDVVLAQSVDYLCGGDAINEAIVLSKLGRKAMVAGKAGPDAIGDMIRSQLKSNGVDASALISGRDFGSGVCVVMVRPDGSRNFLSYRGGTEDYSLEDFDAETLDKVRAVSIGSMFALKKLDGPGVENILRQAREKGVRTFADMKSDTYSIGYKGIRGVMPYLDYFLPSLDEAAYLSGEKDPRKMADCFLSDGAENVVIKLGGDGVYIRGKGEPEGAYLPTYEAPVIDTTGAGDNFVAGFICAVLDDMAFRDCADFANAAASISVGVLGAHGGVKSREQVDLFRQNTQKARQGV
jgi:sugar/nucleoside kinase (ribokinase family)